jgi:hypothetical protein
MLDSNVHSRKSSVKVAIAWPTGQAAIVAQNIILSLKFRIDVTNYQ